MRPAAYTLIPRFKRDAEIQISEDDFVIPPPNPISAAALPANRLNRPLPDAVVLETSIKYDNSLLQKFGGDHTSTKQWIKRVVELTQTVPVECCHSTQRGWGHGASR